ncbi:MAG: hypothetical protein PCFJNLEI_02092 [Verrucomicrobiae bacterium]|nr:hypothetical protein [Verrucomicrobiae bacterium]
MRPPFHFIIGLWLIGLTANAQTNPPVVIPPIDVTAAVLKGVEFFRAQAVTNDEAWLFGPMLGRRVIGYTNRTARFKEVEYIVRGKKTEAYEVMVPGASASEPMRRERRHRVVGFDPSQDIKKTRIVADPNGPILREYQSPLYEKDEGCRWWYGSLGNNGLAILALRRCGVAADDPLVSTPANNLATLLLAHGLPDTLHDLAGLTAGFAVMPGDEFKRLTEECAAKLLDAQITTGPAAGLWGPVAVNTALTAGLLKSLHRLGEEKKALGTELTAERRKKSTSKVKKLEEDIQRIDARIESLQTNSKRITQLGLLLFDSLGSYHNLGRLWLHNQGQRLSIEGLPYLIHNQISADLESTARALFALRVAFENGRLPLKTWRPDPPKSAGPGAPPSAQEFPPAREARTALALAAKTITAARTPDGQWPELNIHQPVTDFAWLKSMPQVSPELFPKLAQPVTLASTVRGAAALADIQMMQSGTAKPTALENAACQSLLPAMFAGKPLANSNDVIRTPYNVLLQTTALHNTSRGKSLRTDFTTWNEVAAWVIGQQTESGGWGRVNKRVFTPSTSHLALRETLGEMKPVDLARNYDKPHLCTGFLDPRWPARYTELEQPYFTTAALLFLADGLPENWTPTESP